MSSNNSNSSSSDNPTSASDQGSAQQPQKKHQQQRRPRSRAARQGRPPKPSPSPAAQRLIQQMRRRLDTDLFRFCAASLYLSPDYSLMLEDLIGEVNAAHEVVGLQEPWEGDEEVCSVESVVESCENAPEEAQEQDEEEEAEGDDAEDTGIVVGVVASEAEDRVTGSDEGHSLADSGVGDVVKTDPVVDESLPVLQLIPQTGLRKFLIRFAVYKIEIAGKMWSITVTVDEPTIVTLGRTSSRTPADPSKCLKLRPDSLDLAKVSKDIYTERKSTVKVKEKKKLRVVRDDAPPPPKDLPETAAKALERELEQLYKSILPSEAAAVDRRYFLGKIQKLIDRYFRGMGMTAHLFGSSSNNLGFPSSDVDVILALPGASNPQQYDAVNVYRLGNVLRNGGMQNIVRIGKARVPICKFYDPQFNFDCDINIGNMLGLHNSELLRTYTLLDPRVKPLIMLVKLWAKKRNINDSSLGTLSSYAYSLMVLNYLQVKGIIPSLQKLSAGMERHIIYVPPNALKRGKMQARAQSQMPRAPSPPSDESDDEDPPSDSDPEDADVTEIHGDPDPADVTPDGLVRTDITFLKDLDHPLLALYTKRRVSSVWGGPEGVVSLFYGFLRYYAWEYTHRSDRLVSVRTGTCIHGTTRQLRNWKTRGGMVLVIEDPFQLDRNCAGTVRDVPRIVDEMRRAARAFCEVKDVDQDSAKAAIAKIFEEVVVPKTEKVNWNAISEGRPGAGRGLWTPFGQFGGKQQNANGRGGSDRGAGVNGGGFANGRSANAKPMHSQEDFPALGAFDKGRGPGGLAGAAPSRGSFQKRPSTSSLKFNSQEDINADRIRNYVVGKQQQTAARPSPAQVSTRPPRPGSAQAVHGSMTRCFSVDTQSTTNVQGNRANATQQKQSRPVQAARPAQSTPTPPVTNIQPQQSHASSQPRHPLPRPASKPNMRQQASLSRQLSNLSLRDASTPAPAAHSTSGQQSTNIRRPSRQNLRTDASSTKASTLASRKCYHCGEEGHIKANCKSRCTKSQCWCIFNV
ncbi:hypothetical protein HK104_007825 [Borealophlyctis nickersoniae]|nr:hypothetical protein HK104_007825 [Borealophlyctis nickersoniae]